MDYKMKIVKIFAVLLLLVPLWLTAQDEAENFSPVEEPSLIQSNEEGVAIDGYDPVAYFSQNKAVKGTSVHSCEYQNRVWHFSSAENRDKFLSNPEKFAPQYGGYCAHSLSNNKLVESDPESFVVRDDKVYLYANNRLADIDGEREDNIFANKLKKRNTNWLEFKSSF